MPRLFKVTGCLFYFSILGVLNCSHTSTQTSTNQKDGTVAGTTQNTSTKENSNGDPSSPTRDTYAQQLISEFELKKKIIFEPRLNHYLNSLAVRLAQAISLSRASEMKILVINDRLERDTLWENTALPHANSYLFYISLSVLKQIAFENEMAALIVIELSNLKADIRGGSYRRKILQNSVKSDSVMNQKIWEKGAGNKVIPPYGIDDLIPLLVATKTAVSALYSVGFDPRGLLTIWNLFLEYPQRSPFQLDMLQELKEATRTALNQFVPIRNPILKSVEFLEMKDRIRAL